MKRHSREKRSKKGAVELSMTTIIIVVIGVTILTLGLRWIYSIFGGLEKQQAELERLTQDQIVEILGGSDEAINIPASVIDNIERGDTYNLQVIVRNKYPETHIFKYDIIIQTTPGNFDAQTVRSHLTWHNQQINLPSGEGFKDFISINTEDLPVGQYNVRIILTCMDCTPIKEESVPVIFEVALK